MLRRWLIALVGVLFSVLLSSTADVTPNTDDSLGLHLPNVTISSYPILKNLISYQRSDHGKIQKRSVSDLDETITRLSNDANSEVWSESSDGFSMGSVSIKAEENEGIGAPDVTVNYGNSSFTIPGHQVPMGRRPQQSSRERRQLPTLMDTLVAPVRRVWPGVEDAGKRFTHEFVPSIGHTLHSMGDEVADVLTQKVLPSLEDSIVEMSNDAVPVINRGIDLASESFEKGTKVLRKATAIAMKRLGIRMLGRRRHYRLSNFVNNVSHRFNDTLARVTNALVGMVNPTTGDSEINSDDFIDRTYDNFYFPGHTGYADYDSNYQDYYYDEYPLQNLSLNPERDRTQNNDDSGVSSLLRNTAYMIASSILGRNLTKAVSPIARSVTKTVENSLPAVSFSKGRIVIDLPGERTDSGEDEGRSCTTPAQEVGICKDLADCPDLILDLTTLRRSVCFKSIFIPGVCCPKSGQRSDDVTSTTTRRPFQTPRPPNPRPTNPRPPVRPPPVPASNAAARPPIPAPHPNALYRCGTARVPEQRVVGGFESPRGKWPWMAAIFLHGPKKTEFWCGASLVSAKFVLTAAHCTKDPNGKTFNPQQFTVRLGDHNIFSHNDDHLSDPSTLRVANIKPHPDFKARGFYNDVALIKLADEVLFNDYTAPICLPPPEMAVRGLDDLVGQSPTVIGYGSTHYDGTESPVLREAKLPVWRNADCDQAYLQPITDIFLCAGYVEGGTDACQGDSGGPLLLFGPSKQWIQIGIVSFGNRCAEPGYPGVYTRLTKFMPWIHDNMLL
ncbi:Serine proteases trypsin domain [Trinorchestia longiramus]|nr:Serine proteases trypsin domain [Trinorchestia longiramus]